MEWVFNRIFYLEKSYPLCKFHNFQGYAQKEVIFTFGGYAGEVPCTTCKVFIDFLAKPVSEIPCTTCKVFIDFLAKPVSDTSHSLA